MTMPPCPQCGYTPTAEAYAMTEIERLVIETLRDVRKSPLSPVSAQVLADVLGYSQAYISEVLGGMKKHGLVCLPRGRCSGWVEGDVLKELAAIIRECSHIT